MRSWWWTAASGFAVTFGLSTLGFECEWCPPPPPPPLSPCATHDPAPVAVATTPSLQGFVDLHTHPMASLGFAGKLLYGGIDVGALLPLDPDCNADVEAGSAEQALGHCGSTHDGTIDNPRNSCGDNFREAVVTTLQLANSANNPDPDSYGYPTFDQWPKWNEVSHQIMWVDWIKRAYLGGLRVMVALAVNNKTLADLVIGTGGVDPQHPDDDKGSADQQILQLKAFVGRHSDWMGIAYGPEDVKTLLQQNKLAVVLGLEVDAIGNFTTPDGVDEAQVDDELVRLHDEGVRYLFPIHVVDNAFGTAAYYQDLFAIANYLQAGHFMNLECSDAADDIDQSMPAALCQPLSAVSVALNLPPDLEMVALALIGLGKADETAAPTCPQCGTGPTGQAIGMVNRGVPFPGLTPLGKFAVLDMMRLGMLIDADHMSEAAAGDTLALALQENYPVNSGHNVVRVGGGSERNFAADAYAKVGQVHGMAGVGFSGIDEATWIQQYQRVVQAMGRADAVAAFGTDADGVSALMRPPSGLPPLIYDDAGFPQSGLGNKCWDYNVEGVAHYGLLSDLVKALPQADGGAFVQGNLMQGAQYFYDTWAIAETYAASHAGDGGSPIAAARARSRPSAAACPAPSTLDQWGLCVPPGTPQVVPPKEPPLAATAAPAILENGAYTLSLRVPHGRGAVPPAQAADFSVTVTSTGRVVALTAPGLTQGSEPAAGVGGFRNDRFVLRAQMGEQRVALVAIVSPGHPLDEVRGSFVAYAPGRTVSRGTFVLRRASTAGPPGEALDRLPAFLENLRE